MLNQFWKREFGDLPQVAHLLRGAFPERWVRFHSLSNSQRYPSSGDEMSSVLTRHNTVISALAGDRDKLKLLTTSYSSTPEPDSTQIQISTMALPASYWCTVAIHEIEPDTDPNCWHIFSSAVDWKPSVLDNALRLVAGDELRNVMILDPDKSWLYHPYDGGADVVLGSASERSQLAGTFEAWLSPRSDGM